MVFDPLAVDGDVALDKFETRVAKAVGQLVLADVHAVNLPVFLFEDGARKRATDEAIGTEDENAEWHNWMGEKKQFRERGPGGKREGRPRAILYA